MSGTPSLVRPAGSATVDFGGTVPDVLWVPADVPVALGALGRTRGPFHDAAGWPDLDEVLRAESADLLAAHGEEAWAAAGGRRDEDGRPTFRGGSPGMAGVLGRLAADPGGYRATDPYGVEWAVRLVRAGGPRRPLVGFAISLPRNLPSGPGGHGPPGTRLWLSGRAAQLMWAVIAAVREQRDLVVRVPDEALAQVVWGTCRAARPKDWRGDLFAVLRSLMRLHSAVIRFGDRGTPPRFDEESVALAHVGYEPPARPAGCGDRCPLRGGPRHGHFVVQIGLGFIGTLDGFLGGAGAAGGRVAVPLLPRLFGAAQWAGLTPGRRALLAALVGERTRRPDGVLVVSDARVPDRAGRAVVACPLLTPGVGYHVFGGNGCRSGLGYRVVGTTNGGWLSRCGYEWGEAEDPTPAVRAFLADLAGLADLFGLVVVGVGPGPEVWVPFPRLRQMAAGRGGWRRVDPVHLRVYAPADFDERVRAYFEQAGGFRTIPGRPGEARAEGAPEPDLIERLRAARLPQAELARDLGVSQPYVSMLLARKKAVSDRLATRVSEVLARHRRGVADGVRV